MANIVVEGPIGVGKTSLARLLAAELGAREVLEVVEENPFLARFYSDPGRYAFPAQAFFLLSRFKQFQELGQGTLFAPHTVADYLFDKDWIFASLTLEGDEWALYRDLYRSLRPKLPEPDLVIYLRADPELLLRRIARRARPFEHDIGPDYLRRLGEAYDRFFSHTHHPLHVVEAADVDFVASEADRRALLDDVLHLAEVA
jgi:deoxyadenosine/deoxycytidine kinase